MSSKGGMYEARCQMSKRRIKYQAGTAICGSSNRAPAWVGGEGDAPLMVDALRIALAKYKLTVIGSNTRVTSSKPSKRRGVDF